MAQTKKFPGVVSSKDTFKRIKNRKKSENNQKRSSRWKLEKGRVNGEIRELFSDSSKTSKADNKMEEKKISEVKNKNLTQPEIRGTSKEEMNKVYNSHRPDLTLNSLQSEMGIMERIRSRSKPLNQNSFSGQEIRNKYQEMRSKQQNIKLYKRLKTEALSKDIEKRLKRASKSPRRDNNYLGLNHKQEGEIANEVRIFQLKSKINQKLQKEKNKMENSQVSVAKQDRSAKLEELIRSHSKQNRNKMEFFSDSISKKDKKNTIGSLKKRMPKTKENTMRSKKQWESSRVDNHSQGRRRRKRNQSSSSQNPKFKNQKNLKNDLIKINPNDSEFKVSLLLRVREEMSMKHVKTYNYLKNWFSKIFINGSNSQEKFYQTFEKYLSKEEHIFFLCFGQKKSGKTYSIQGKKK